MPALVNTFFEKRVKQIFDMRQSFIGSTVAIVVGVIAIAGALRHASVWIDMDGLMGGVSAILGALAYRLAKQRRLGLKPDSGIIRSTEIILLSIVVAVPIVQTALGVDFATRPWSNLVIPAWAMTAYLFARLKKIGAPAASRQRLL